MEGRRYFDLVRWGEAEVTMDTYLAYERNKIEIWMEQLCFREAIVLCFNCSFPEMNDPPRTVPAFFQTAP